GKDCPLRGQRLSIAGLPISPKRRRLRLDTTSSTETDMSDRQRPPATADQLTRGMLEAAAAFGFYPAVSADLPMARVVAAKLMEHQVASEATLGRILLTQPASTLIHREDGVVAGMVATLLLRPEAEPVLRAGAFDGLTPPPELLASGADPVAFYYLWGIAGS